MIKRTKQIIRLLNEIDLNESNAYENIISLIENGEIEIPYLTYKVQKGMIVYRSRENEMEDYFTSICELSCPKSDQVKYYNRANSPFQSVFYCSDKRETSYSEFMEKFADYPLGTTFSITIGMWRIIRDLNLILISNQESLIGKLNQVKGPHWTKENIELHKYIVNKFVQSAYKDKTVYIMTSAIANTLLSKCLCDGIMYPSIPTNGNGINIALKREVYENDGIILNAVIKETFKTYWDEESGKPLHISIGIKNGQINQLRKTIEW